MLYRLQIITDDDQWEMWGRSSAEASERFQREVNKPHQVFLCGSVPDWLTLKTWQKLCSVTADERVARALSWALDEMLDA